MSKEAQRIDVSNDPTLLRLAQEVARSGQARLLGTPREALAVLVPVEPKRAEAPPRPKRRRGTAGAAFLRHYQSIPALATPLTDRELTELAAEEAIAESVRDGR